MKYKELTDVVVFDRKSNKQEFRISVDLVKSLFNDITDETTGFVLTIKESDEV